MKIVDCEICDFWHLYCRTYAYERNIHKVAARLQQSYANYYNVSHTIQEIICEPETDKMYKPLTKMRFLPTSTLKTN